MKDSDKRKIVEFVGLKWHEIDQEKEDYHCTCCEYAHYSEYAMRCHFHQFNIDPTTCCGMAKVLKALKKDLAEWLDFQTWVYTQIKWSVSRETMGDLYTSDPDLAQALLDYINEKEGE